MTRSDRDEITRLAVQFFSQGGSQDPEAFGQAVWQAAIKHEREECAKLCVSNDADPTAQFAVEEVAAAIRARSELK